MVLDGNQVVSGKVMDSFLLNLNCCGQGWCSKASSKSVVCVFPCEIELPFHFANWSIPRGVLVMTSGGLMHVKRLLTIDTNTLIEYGSPDELIQRFAIFFTTPSSTQCI